MSTIQLHIPKLALILRIYYECNRIEIDNKEVKMYKERLPKIISFKAICHYFSKFVI